MPEGTSKIFKVGEKSYDIPIDSVDLFLEDMPDAQEVLKYSVGDKKYGIPANDTTDFLKDFPEAKPLFQEIEIPDLGLDKRMNEIDSSGRLISDQIKSINQQRDSVINASGASPTSRNKYYTNPEGKMIASPSYRRPENVSQYDKQLEELNTQLQDNHSKRMDISAAKDFIAKAEKYKSSGGKGESASSFLSGLTSMPLKEFATLGISSMFDEFNVLSAVNKAAAGDPISPEEDALLQAYGTLQEIQATTEGVPISYRFGRGLAEMAPYIAQFALTSGSATLVREGIGVLVKSKIKGGIKKRILEEGFKAGYRSLKKEGKKEIGKRILGYATGAAAQTPLMSMGYEDFARRRIGRVDSEGNIDPDSRASIPEAIFKAYATQYSEVFTEGLGDYIFLPFKAASRIAKKGSKGAFKTGVESVREAAKFGNVLEEYSEELINSYLQPLLTGEYFTGEVKLSEIWNTEDQFVTFLTVAAMGGTFYGSNQANKLYNEQANRRKYLKGLNPAIKQGIINANKLESPDEVNDAIVKVIEGSEITVEQAKGIINYSAKKAYNKGSIEGERVEVEETIKENIAHLANEDGNVHEAVDGKGNKIYVKSETPGGFAMVLDENGQPVNVSVSDIENRNVMAPDQVFADQMAQFEAENTQEEEIESETFKLDNKKYAFREDITSKDGEPIASEVDEDGNFIGEVQVGEDGTILGDFISVNEEMAERITSQLDSDPETEPEVRTVMIGKKEYTLKKADDALVTDPISTKTEAEETLNALNESFKKQNTLEIFEQENDDPSVPSTFQVVIKPKESTDEVTDEGVYIYREGPTEISRDDIEEAIILAGTKEELKDISTGGDPEIEAMIEKRFPTPVTSYKIGKKEVTIERAKARIKRAKTDKQLKELKIENDEELQAAYDKRMTELGVKVEKPIAKEQPKEIVKEAEKKPEPVKEPKKEVSIEDERINQLIDVYNNSKNPERKKTVMLPGIKEAAKKLGYDVIVKGDKVSIEKPEPKIIELKPKRKKPLSKVQIQAGKIDATSPYQEAMQYFINGGKINKSALFTLYGTKGKENDPLIKKKIESERRGRFTWVSETDGLGIDDIAHDLWENRAIEGSETGEYRDAIEDIINSYKSPIQMAKDFIDQMEGKESEFSDEEIKGMIDQQENESEYEYTSEEEEVTMLEYPKEFFVNLHKENIELEEKLNLTQNEKDLIFRAEENLSEEQISEETEKTKGKPEKEVKDEADLQKYSAERKPDEAIQDVRGEKVVGDRSKDKPTPESADLDVSELEKQPYEMTRDEYGEFINKNLPPHYENDKESIEIKHRLEIKQAISEGKTIPLNILESYKDKEWAQKQIEKQSPVKETKVPTKTKEEAAKVGLTEKEIKRKPVYYAFAKSIGATDDMSDILEGEALRADIDGVGVIINDGKDKAVIESIEVPVEDRKQGKARKAMDKIISEADKVGIDLELDAIPEEGTEITQEQLINFYKQFGFEFEKETGIRKHQKQDGKPREQQPKRSDESSRGTEPIPSGPKRSPDGEQRGLSKETQPRGESGGDQGRSESGGKPDSGGESGRRSDTRSGSERGVETGRDREEGRGINIIVANNTNSAYDQDAQKNIQSFLTKSNKHTTNKMVKFMEGSGQNKDDFTTFFYHKEKTPITDVMFRSNIEDAYEDALGSDDESPSFISVTKKGKDITYQASVENDLLGDYTGEMYDDKGVLKKEVKDAAINLIKSSFDITPTESKVKPLAEAEKRKVLFKDENGNNIVFEKGDYRISINNPNNATLSTLWHKETVKGKDYWAKRGVLRANVADRRFYGDKDFLDYLKISEVEIEKEHRGQKLGYQLYKAVIDFRGDNIVGMFSYTPSRINKKEVPSIWKRLGGKEAIGEADYQLIRFDKKESKVKPLKEAEKDVDTNPSEAQIDAGNYKKGHTTIQGMDITIENPKGSERKGTDEEGREWKVTLQNSYGYFKKTTGKDGDQIDVFIGDNIESNAVFVVDQVNKNRTFDEVKVMLGFDNVADAANAYLSNYSKGWNGMGDISESNIDSFKDWLENGKTDERFKTGTAWSKVYPGISTLVANEGEMSKPKEQEIRVLRSEGDKSKRGMVEKLPSVSKGYGEKARERSKDDIGQDEQQRELLQGKLQVGNVAGAVSEQAKREDIGISGKEADDKGVGRGVKPTIKDIEAKDSRVQVERGESVITTTKQKIQEENLLNTATTPSDLQELLSQGKVKKDAAYDKKMEELRGGDVKFKGEDDVTKTENFKNWFGDSKVVDEDGKPIVVFHGSDNIFNVFEQKGEFGFPEASYFTSSKKLAKQYGKQLSDVFLSIKNPHIIDVGGSSFNDKYVELLSGMNYAKENDFDGLIIKNINDSYLQNKDKAVSDVYVIFKPNQVKLADGTNIEFSESEDIRFKAEPFYSPTEKALNSIKQEKATPEQWKAMLLKNGAKQAELDWMGFDEFIKDKKSLTKQDIQDFVDQNKIEVEDVEKYDIIEEDIDMLLEDELGENMSREDAREYLENEERTTKFSEYQLPGAENYKEVLLTMPNKFKELSGDERDRFSELAKKEAFEEYLTDSEKKELYKYAARTKGTMGDNDFKSAHFDEPNILAHIRFNERTDADGNKVLFIEELQSDWAQEGRKKGFVKKENKEGYKIELANDGGTLNHRVTFNGDYVGRYATEIEAEAAITNKLPAYKENKGTPNMPFKKTDQWINLSLRRIIRYAAENGFDRIAWTTGEQQAERYDLSKQIDRIEYVEVKGGTNGIVAYKNGEEVLDRDVKNEEEIANMIGKDVAKKLLESPVSESGPHSVRSLKGDNLKVGSAGMTAFYDQIIPKLANKIGKKFGSKVEDVSLKTGTSSELKTAGEITRVLQLGNGVQVYDDEGSKHEFLTSEKEFLNNYTSPEGASFNLDDNYGYYEIDKGIETNVNSLPITDKMYETAIGEGFPLFKKPTDFETLPEYFTYKRGQAAKNIETIKQVGVDMSKKLGVKVNVVEYHNDLPQKIKREFSKRGLTKTYGVYDPASGEVYLVAFNLDGDVKLATETALHEVIGHKGLWNLLGTKANPILDLVWNGMNKANQKAYFDRFNVLNEDKTLNTQKTERLASEEYFAEQAEKDKKPNFIQRAIAKIRELIRKLFPNLRYSNSDVLDLLKRSKQKLKEDSKVTQVTQVSEVSKQEPKFKAEDKPTRIDKKEAELKAKGEELKREIISQTNHARLKRKIKDMKVGYRLGKLDMRDQTKDVQNDIIKYANKYMPLAEAGKRDVGKLLTMVKNTTDPVKLDGIFDKIDGMTAGINKKKSIKDIDAILKRTEVKKVAGKIQGKLSPDTQALIEKIRAITGLKSSNEYIDNLQTDDIESVALFSVFGNLKDKSQAEIDKAHAILNELVTTGKIWFKEEMERRKLQHDQIRDVVVDKITGGKGITSAQDLKASGEANVKKWYNNQFINKNQSFEWLMDIISQDKTEKTGQGYMQNRFGDILNAATNEETAGHRKYVELLNEKAGEIFGKEKNKLANKLSENARQIEKSGVTYMKNGKRVELPLSQNEAYKKWMELQDPRLGNTFVNMGWDQTTVDQLNNFIDADVKKWAEWQLNEFYPEYYKSVNKVYRKNYFVDLPFNEFYSPITREITDVKDTDDPLLKNSRTLAGVGNASLKSRVSNVNPLAFKDGDNVLANHLAQMEHFKAWVDPMRELRSVFGSRDVQHALKFEHGNGVRNVINAQIDDFARGGIDRALVVTIIDKIRRNFVTAELGLNYGLFPKQLVSSFTYMTDLPIADYMKGMTDFISNPMKVIDILKESELIKNRYKSGWTHEVESALKSLAPETLAGTKTRFQQMRNILMLPTKLGDRFAIFGGWPVYKYYYDQKIADGAPIETAEKFAMNKFERIASRSQQSAKLKDTSQLQKGSLGKLFTMFHNSQQQYFRYEMAALRNLSKGRGNVLHNLKIIGITHFLLPILFQLVSNWFTDADEDKEKKRLLRAAILGSWNGLLIAGDIMEYGLEKLFGERWGYTPSPIFGSVENMGYGMARIAKGITETDQDALIKGVDNILHALSQTVLGVPYRPSKKIYKEISELFNPDIEKQYKRAVSDDLDTVKSYKEAIKDNDKEEAMKIANDNLFKKSLQISYKDKLIKQWARDIKEKQEQGVSDEKIQRLIDMRENLMKEVIELKNK